MSLSLCPTFGVGWQGFTSGGLPLNAGLLNTYAAGTTNAQATYQTSSGTACANPIVLAADGRPTTEIWLTDGQSYRFDLTDALGNLIKTYDNIAAVPSLASSNITFLQAGTGAVQRTVQSKERDVVSVLDFAANGVSGVSVDPTGSVDSTLGIQAALNASKAVFVPVGLYKVTSTITLPPQCTLFGIGPNGGNKSATASTTFLCTGNFPCFKDTVGSFSEFNLSGFLIWYSDTPPAVADNTAGFLFNQASWWYQFSKFENICVKGATYAIYDSTGSYMSTWDRVFSWNCLLGFYKNNGTTFHFRNCSTAGGAQGFQIFNLLTSTFTCCASDGMTVTNTVYGANCFSGCIGLTINGWDHEGNTVAPNSRLWRFINSAGLVNGIAGVGNTLQTTAGSNTQAIYCSDGCRLAFSGSRMALQIGDLAVSGTGGSVFTLQTGGTANYISIDGSSFIAPTGGTPTNRYSVASAENSLPYKNSDFSGGFIINCRSLDRTSALYVPAITDSGAVGTSTTTTAIGDYSTVGDECIFKLQIVQSAYSVTGASQVQISVPIPPDATSSSGDGVPISVTSSGLTLAAGAQLVGLLYKANGNIQLYTSNAGTLAPLPTSTTGFATSTFFVNGSYICNLFPSG